MITFSVAMMIAIPNAVAAWKGGNTQVEVPGALFVITGIMDVFIVSIIWG